MKPKWKPLWITDERSCWEAHEERVPGAVRYTPRDGSAEVRAARFERALAKIERLLGKISNGENALEYGADAYDIARRALAKEKGRKA